MARPDPLKSLSRMKWTPFLVFAVLVGCASPKREDPARDTLTVDPKQIETVETPLEPPNVIEPKVDYPDGIALRLKFQQGEKYSREIVGQISAQFPGQSKVEEVISVGYDSETVAVEDGVATVKITTTTLKAGSAARQPEVLELKVDQTGRLIEAKRGLLSSAVTVAFVPFPYSRVKPRSEWALETTFNEAIFGDVDYVQKFTYRGMKTVRGKQAWQVDTRAEGSDKINIKGTYYFDSSNGQLIEGSFTMNARAEMQNAEGTTQKATMKLDVKVMPKS